MIGNKEYEFSFTVEIDPHDSEQHRAIAAAFDTTVWSDGESVWFGPDVDVELPPEAEAWLAYHREGDDD